MCRGYAKLYTTLEKNIQDTTRIIQRYAAYAALFLLLFLLCLSLRPLPIPDIHEIRRDAVIVHLAELFEKVKNHERSGADGEYDVSDEAVRWLHLWQQQKAGEPLKHQHAPGGREVETEAYHAKPVDIGIVHGKLDDDDPRLLGHPVIVLQCFQSSLYGILFLPHHQIAL